MSDVDEIKSRLNIVDVIGSRIKLKKTGRHFKAICPFHAEKTPSFVVSSDRQIWKCFGCGKGGSIIDFVMEFDHLDFIEALELLAGQAGITLDHARFQTPETKRKDLLYEVNHMASEFYHYLLTKHALGEKARLYLKNRGISDKSIKTFALGYSPNSWEGLLRFLRKKGYDEKLIEEAGLILASRSSTHSYHNYYDRFRGRVIFTLKDHRGHVVGFSGRLLDPDAKEAKYINTSETPVYSKSNMLYGLDVTKDAIQKANQAILVEGEFDVISSFQVGVGNVVAIKGSALTEGHVHLLKRFTERLVFALDTDGAGDAASRRGIEIADKAGFDIQVAVFPSGKDPDEAARTDEVGFKKAIQKTIPFYDYCIDSAVKRLGIDTAFGKKKVSEELIPIIAHIDNAVVADHYIKKLATVLDISQEAIADGINKFRQHVNVPKRTTTHTPELSPQTRLEKLELYLLAILLQGNTSDFYEEFREVCQIKDIKLLPIKRIVEKLGDFIENHRVFLIKDFADSLSSELVGTLDDSFLVDLSTVLDTTEHTILEWTKILSEYRRLLLRQKIQELSSQLKKLDPQDDEKEAILQTTLQELVGNLKQLEKTV